MKAAVSFQENSRIAGLNNEMGCGGGAATTHFIAGLSNAKIPTLKLWIDWAIDPCKG